MIYQKMPEGVPVYSVAYGGPFMGVRGHFLVEDGPTLFDLVAGIPDLPPGFMERGEVRISDNLVPRHLWPFVRPRVSVAGTYVTLHLAPRGSGEGQDGAKNIIGIVAALALTIATAGIAGGALAGLGGVFAAGGIFGAGTIGAQVLALGVGLAGSLAVAALTAPPTSTSTPRKIAETSPASADGNLADPGGALPRVIGTRRVFPPYVNDAFYEIVGRDEYVTIVCALAGPHDLSDIKLGDSPIDSSDGIEYETRQGNGDDAALTLATKQARITGSPFQFSEHLRDPDNYTYLKDQALPDTCLPVWHSVATRHGPDEFRIRLDFPAGIMDGAADQEDVYQAVPFRVRIRPIGGSTWINLPEVFYCSRNREAKRTEIILDWGSEPAMPTPTLNRGWIYAWRSVPTQTVNPVGTGGWTAHPYFGTSGDVYLRYNNTGTTGVLHTHLTEESARFYLDPEMFQKAVYEAQMIRGVMVPKNYITAPSYTMAGTSVYDLFGKVLDAGIYKVLSFSSESGVSQCAFLRGTSAWNSPPVAAMGDALIAVKAKNRRLDTLSVLASGLVPDWDGMDWTGAVSTSNPAPHYRYVLSGALNLDPLDEELIDDDALVDWRAHCATEGYTCDSIVQGSRVQDVLSLIASCGYARPVQSEKWGVFIDRDTSGESTMQVFSPRNSSGFRFEKALTRLPDGFRVTYREKKADYAEQQITVYRDGVTAGGNFEAVAYDGLVTEAHARGRASFDLAQAVQRATFYYLEAPPEAIPCRRGDLVGVCHDVLRRQAGAARVKSKTVVSGDITHLLLDSEVPVVNEDDMLNVADMLAVADMLEVGMSTGLVIRRQDGTFSSHRIAGASGSRALIEIETPFADADATLLTGHGSTTVKAVGEADEGSLVYWGPVDQETRRMLVFGVAPSANRTYSLTLVDEAPDLIRSAAGTYDDPGSATYDLAGTFYFIVPNYETELTVDMIGGSAGSHGITNASTYVAGTAGGDTTFNGMTAGGSPVPVDRLTGGAGGTATGGDTNTNGNAGGAPTGTTASGVGGSAPGGGAGGAAVTANGNGNQGTAPGGGASGSFRTISAVNYPTSGTGGGARVQKTYAPGDLTPGDVLTIVVGAGGTGGDGTLQDGGAGQRGQATFTWS